MNDQDLTKTDYDPDRSLVLIEGLSHFLTNFLQNLASCQTSFSKHFSVYGLQLFLNVHVEKHVWVTYCREQKILVVNVISKFG
jgi:hypothetical protein